MPAKETLTGTEAVAEGQTPEQAMDSYINISVALADFGPITPEQRAGIRNYFSFASTMMAPLLAFELPGE